MMNRREFLQAGMAAAAVSAQAQPRKYRAAIIGDTGRGGYGHGWDTAWNHFPSVEVVAVADPNDEGRLAAMTRSGVERGYSDYRDLLKTEEPTLVAICPRWPDQRLEMVTAAAQSGAHMLVEKPFARNLKEADAMVAAAERNKVKVQVGHIARTAPVARRLQRMILGGEIGVLQEVRARGKEDARAGGEDMIVLGTHEFDLLRMFLGDPKWVFGHVTQDGQEMAQTQVRKGSEPVGPVAGNQIAAMFAFGTGMHGYFGSKTSDVPAGVRYAVTFYGSKGVICFPMDSYPGGAPFILRSSSWLPGRESRGWQNIEVPAEEQVSSREQANAVMVADLLDAIEQDREPACSARDGRWTIEMAVGVYQSQKSGARVAFPLKDRRHPLEVS
jgi:predicted dehydrogenase